MQQSAELARAADHAAASSSAAAPTVAAPVSDTGAATARTAAATDVLAAEGCREDNCYSAGLEGSAAMVVVAFQVPVVLIRWRGDLVIPTLAEGSNRSSRGCSTKMCMTHLLASLVRKRNEHTIEYDSWLLSQPQQQLHPSTSSNQQTASICPSMWHQPTRSEERT